MNISLILWFGACECSPAEIAEFLSLPAFYVADVLAVYS